MYKYIETIYPDHGPQWDVYAMINDSVYMDDCIAITGPDSFLDTVYAARNSLETFTALIRTDFFRGIDFIQLDSVDAVKSAISTRAGFDSMFTDSSAALNNLMDIFAA